MKKILIASSIGLVVILGVWLGLYLGVYNIAANDKHFAITTSLLDFVRTRSIEARSYDIKVPNLNNVQQIANGAKNYDEMCTTCHLAPDMDETELNQGLYPRPPIFSNKDYSNKPQAQFWVIKNGLKMTGMPAWSPPHNDEQVWAMVAFINKSNTLSGTDYQQLISQADIEEGGHGHGQKTNEPHDKKLNTQKSNDAQVQESGHDNHSH